MKERATRRVHVMRKDLRNIIIAICIVTIAIVTTACTTKTNNAEANAVQQEDLETEVIKSEPAQTKVADIEVAKQSNEELENSESQLFFAIMDADTEDKVVISDNEVYTIKDGEDLILYYGDNRLKQILFLPEGIISVEGIKNTGKYYTLPISKAGSINMQFDIQLSNDETISRKFILVNEKSDVEETVSEIHEETQQKVQSEATMLDQSIPIEDCLVQVAAELEWSSLVVWNEETGARQIVGPGTYKINKGDKFAVVAPFEIGSCRYTLNGEYDIFYDDLLIEGSVAYIELPDEEIDRLCVQVSPVEGVDLGPNVTNNKHNVMAYFE